MFSGLNKSDFFFPLRFSSNWLIYVVKNQKLSLLYVTILLEIKIN